MKQYWLYLKYLLKHKWYVLIECWKIGLYWRGITHDMSNFLPGEFFPYANYFYGSKFPDSEWHGDMRLYVPYEKTESGIENEFNLAWLRHQNRNDHHWQYWLLVYDDGFMKMSEMNCVSLNEMICDWVGAGRIIENVYSSEDPYKEAREWYLKKRSTILLGLQTREQVEKILNITD